jgi:hypothetical protein
LAQAESLKEAGFCETTIAKSRPLLNDAAAETVYLWGLMGGWYPERLPALLAMLDLEHIDGLVDRLLVIRAKAMESRKDG